ncbi:MAG: 1-(5-phosphoribosyl)-5-[(5-phosphoribosylamino)methylideneamino]imidazole-4-carboxamide isomerase [candidate division WS1 bacterium]|nr:1-(5-phosphoribosyl)-5-[(5-phosphoribosylamino)methylideneamino]imidazole-4-carboxamide isomerase [candidate division WS1 bacterium]
MLILPAIDLSEGQVVRLRQGDMAQKTVFSADPAAQARVWEDQGAEALHLVDLDGAFAGEPRNLPAVEKIVESVGIPCELGGGLRSVELVEQALALGVRWAIMGTSALRNRLELEAALTRFGDQVIVGIDARDGLVALEGWAEASTVDAYDLARQVEAVGVERIIFTDIATDGMLRGANVPAMRRMRETVTIPVIASGGVTTLEDVVALREAGLFGCIIGRALYDGSLRLPEALSAAQ